MRKVQFLAGFWTIVLAIPFTFLALIGVAYLTENLTQIINIISNFSREISVEGRGLVLEFSARWPEIAGMVIGMIVLLTIYLFAQNANKAEDPKNLN
jgi:ABC-type dipeptide/oligopeptide/nickel transport system permease subunit